MTAMMAMHDLLDAIERLSRAVIDAHGLQAGLDARSAVRRLARVLDQYPARAADERRRTSAALKGDSAPVLSVIADMRAGMGDARGRVMLSEMPAVLEQWRRALELAATSDDLPVAEAAYAAVQAVSYDPRGQGCISIS